MKGFPIHPSVEEGIQQVDAALFNGDTFDDPENRAYLKGYVQRWLRRVEEDERRVATSVRTDTRASTAERTFHVYYVTRTVIRGYVKVTATSKTEASNKARALVDESNDVLVADYESYHVETNPLGEVEDLYEDLDEDDAG